MIDDFEGMAQPVVKLSRQIGEIAQVESMADDELERMQALHEAEILKLANRLDFSERVNPGSEVALRVLRLHKRWIDREIKRRDDADRALRIEEQVSHATAARESRLLRQRAFAIQQERATQARMDRIREANDEDRRMALAFKRRVRAVLGDETYLRLWSEVETELKQGKELT